MPVTATDKFALAQEGLESPASVFAMISPSNTDDLAHISREITVGVPGDVAVLLPDGLTSVTIPESVWTVQPVQAIRVKRIKATGTAATDILVKF
jgi:hypothetical protein